MTLHLMAKEYGKLPTELLGLDLLEFNLNAAILTEGTAELNRQTSKG